MKDNEILTDVRNVNKIFLITYFEKMYFMKFP